MTYRLHDDVESGGRLEYGGNLEYGGRGWNDLADPDDAAAGELAGRGRHGAHSSDYIADGQRRYTYQRPAGAARGGRHHAEPADDDTDHTRDRAAARGFSWRDQPSPAGDPAPYGTDPAGYEPTANGLGGYPPQDSGRSRYAGRAWQSDRRHGDVDGHRWGSVGEAGAWEAEALAAAAGVSYREDVAGSARDRYPDYDGPDQTAQLFSPDGVAATVDTSQYRSARAGTLTAPRPVRRDLAEAPPDGVPAEVEVEVPIAPPAEGQSGRKRTHLLLRIAAVVVLVLGAAVGIAAGVLRDDDPDTVEVTNDLQADAANNSASPDSNAGTQSDGAQERADLLMRQRQQAAVDDAQSRAAAKAADAQSAAATVAERAKKERASRSAARAADAEADADAETGTTGDPVPTAPVDCDSYSGNQKTGCALLSEFSFASSQMTCLEKLWDKESGWRTSAENPSSGAYGIPQALPGSKMATVASDWRTNAATQIRWGLGYIKGRYGTPCQAWSHSQSNGWY